MGTVQENVSCECSFTVYSVTDICWKSSNTNRYATYCSFSGSTSQVNSPFFLKTQSKQVCILENLIQKKLSSYGDINEESFIIL